MSDEKLVAGDAVAEKRVVDGIAIDKAGESHIEKVEAAVEAPAPIAAPIVVVPATSNEPKFDGMRCATCREVKTDAQLMKQPIDYKKNADGSVSTTPARYSIFCGTCQKFLGIYDPVAQNELNTMLKNRNDSAKR